MSREPTPATQYVGDLLAFTPEGPGGLRELGVHLRALRSFFKISNHPLAETERSEILARDFINEARIAHDFLLRCAELSFTQSLSASQVGLAEAQSMSHAASLSLGSDSGPGEDCLRHKSIGEAINDLFLLCASLVEGGRVGFKTWAALGAAVSRELESIRVEEFIEEDSDAYRLSAVPQALLTLSTHVAPDPLAADVGSIFSRLFRLLELLRFVDSAMNSGEPLKQTLPYFTSLREESCGLLDLVGERTLRIEGLDPSVHEQIDATAYAVRMELRKAFEHELVGLSALRHAPQIYAKVENAHGLLRDCFQQSVISVARAFDARYDGSSLFNSFRTKLEQSLLLRRELWAVLDAVRHLGDGQEPRALQTLRRRLDSFRHGGLRYLMYKDWESFEMFVEEVTDAKGAAELQPALHRFHAFLETLLSQVSMRAVLADHPFTPPALED